jgi:hypothetical protein
MRLVIKEVNLRGKFIFASTIQYQKTSEIPKLFLTLFADLYPE